MPASTPKGPPGPPKTPNSGPKGREVKRVPRAEPSEPIAEPAASEETQVVARPSARIKFDSPEDLVGHTLNNRYKILSLLGSGGMGTVYLAEHVLIHKQVAIKVLSPAHAKKPAEVERFLREARAASRIRQENVVDITDFGYTSGGLAFLVMEYLEGEDLATTSQRDGALPWRRAVRITRQICSALEAAHAQGVIHRDMKPENVFRVRRGHDNDFIKVLDFGIAKIIDENFEPSLPSSTNSGLLGTPEYVAPELIRGLQPDARVDIYAVGVILYRLLTGRVPFAGDSFMATLTQHLMEPPKPLRQVAPDMHIPEELEAVCLRTLNKERDLRYAEIKDLTRALETVELTHPEQSIIASAHGAAEPPPRRPVLLLTLVALVLLLVGAGAAYQLTAGPSPEEPLRDTPAAQPTTPPVAPPTVAPPPVVTPPVTKQPDPVPSDEPDPETIDPPDPGKTDPIIKPDGPRAPLPDKLSQIELRSKMDRVQEKVQAECARFSLKKMSVGLKITVAASGKVQDATPTGSQAGSLAACVIKVAKSVKYRPAQQGTSFEYTFRM